MKEELSTFLLGALVGVAGLMMILSLTGHSPREIIDKYEKEALSRGYMKKKITSDDKVIYIWVENKDL